MVHAFHHVCKSHDQFWICVKQWERTDAIVLWFDLAIPISHAIHFFIIH